MTVPEVAPEEAKRLLDAGEASCYLDVRTEAEFAAGHVPGAINIPVARINAATGRMEPDPSFAHKVRAKLSKGAKIIVGCRSGPRSEAACHILREHGYEHVVNLRGGFEGVRDPQGQVLVEGWATLGLPVERGPSSG
ncbi:MAG: rhodanese-like domain-containing protein [Planctomycetota bacterium]|nr:MAG: rhodanese-like domain-containing protein [Planctomycetota bacterium]